MPSHKLEIVVPAKLWERMEDIEQKRGIRKEDLLMMALVRLIEEFEKSRE